MIDKAFLLLEFIVKRNPKPFHVLSQYLINCSRIHNKLTTVVIRRSLFDEKVGHAIFEKV